MSLLFLFIYVPLFISAVIFLIIGIIRKNKIMIFTSVFVISVLLILLLMFIYYMFPN